MRDELYTVNALQANRVAAMFRATFATKKVGGASVDISEPEESTQKGALALQHVTLKDPSGMGVVVGSVNAITRVAELRGYAAVARMHEERFKLPPSFDAAMYASFVDAATTVLTEQGLRVSLASGDTASHDVSDAASPASSARATLMIALAIGAAVGAAIMWLAR